MLTVFDRYILKSLLVNYLIALGVMTSLYIVLDLFVNMDEFTEHGYPALIVAKNIFGYYWPNVFLYFSQLSGAITLFACLSTVARMRKLNELTAVLASGVSLYRVAAPIISFGMLSTGLLIVDTEWIIPSLAHKLARDHDDADGVRAYEVLFLRDRGGALMSAGQFHPVTRDLRRLLVLSRDETGAIESVLEADRAVWEPAPVTPAADDSTIPKGRWLLDRGRMRLRIRSAGKGLGPSEQLEERFPVAYESDLSPESIQMRQAEGWMRFLSLRQLRKIEESDAPNVAAAVQTRHARTSAPLVNMVLLLLGLPFFLNRSATNVVSDAGKCLTVCGLCYVVSFVSQSIRPETQSALPAWIPILLFVPLAIVLIDRIRT